MSSLLKENTMETNEACHFEVDTAYTPFAYLSIVQAQNRSQTPWVRPASISIGIVLLMIDAVIIGSHLTRLLSVIGWIIALTGIGLWILVSGVNIEKQLAKKMWKDHHRHLGHVTYRFYTTFFEASNPKDYVLKYEDIFGLYETEEHFLIFADKQAVNVIAKNGFVKGNENLFRQNIAKAANKEWIRV